MTDRDRGDVYAVIPMPQQLRGPEGWWTVTLNGAPVRHFPPESKHLAERYARDAAYRASLVTTKYHDHPPRRRD